MEDNNQDKLIGKIIFKLYKIIKKLGEGSFGKIYIALHLEKKKLYAVKLVNKIINNNLIIYFKNFKNIGKTRYRKKSFRNRNNYFRSVESLWNTKIKNIWL